MGTFKAGVQYGDWHGTASADNSDAVSLHKYLEDKGLMKEGEFLVAVELWAGENHNNELGTVSVRAFLFDGPTTGVEAVRDRIAEINDEDAIPVRVVDVKLSLAKFVSVFKRFSVMLTWRPLQETIEGREYRASEEE